MTYHDLSRSMRLLPTESRLMPAPEAEHDVHQAEAADGNPSHAVHPAHRAFGNHAAQQARHTGQNGPPVSEACRGVLTTLNALGLDVKKRDLPALRRWFGSQN